VNRAAGIARLQTETFDVLVVGGGATGLGAAVDAAARGYRTALIESEDFAKATSSRSTKLVHGGVRYLQQGDIGLVREALHERTNLLRNAPHLVHELRFVVPAYRWFELAYYGAGLAAYDLLAGRSDLARSRIVGSRRARELLPGLRADGLRGAIVYSDAQFDDARLAVTLARTAVDHGAAVANYVRATGFVYDVASGSHRAAGTARRIAGVEALDRETNRTFTIRARAVINATGIFVDEVRSLDDRAAKPLLTHSRGSHIVVRASALGADGAALLIPRTPDGRVLFALPWHEHVVIGTTDIAASRAELDPLPTRAEIAYLLETVNRYLTEPLAENDVLAAFAGLRPLVDRKATTSAKQSREHTVDVSPSGLVTIAGGKWTTYRKMAEDVVDAAAARAGLPQRPSPTAVMPLHGAPHAGAQRAHEGSLTVYGTDAAAVAALRAHDPGLRERLHPSLSYTGAEVVYAARHEMARTVDDVLSRRTRAAFLDTAAARASAPAVAALLARELGRDEAWQAAQVPAFGALLERFPAPAQPGEVRRTATP
jgi:glycerol-3-phosphate dehydrogenase